jgi:hypothetical protein
MTWNWKWKSKKSLPKNEAITWMIMPRHTMPIQVERSKTHPEWKASSASTGIRPQKPQAQGKSAFLSFKVDHNRKITPISVNLIQTNIVFKTYKLADAVDLVRNPRLTSRERSKVADLPLAIKIAKYASCKFKPSSHSAKKRQKRNFPQ